MRGQNRVTAALLLCVSAAAAAAEQQPICATRPGKSMAPCTVPAGRFQLETGFVDWSLQKSGSERNTSLAIGQTALKYGLTDRSDIEVAVMPWQRSTSRAGGVRQSWSGFGDLFASYKQGLTANDAPLQLALLASVKIPTAKQPLGNGQWEAELLMPILYSIGKTPFSINLTPEFDWAGDADGHGHHAAMTQVASVGIQATPKLSFDGEIWTRWDWDPAGTKRQASADGSVAYLLNSNVQVDAGANFGLNRNTPDVELYSGLSGRF
jgi:hypothetical protein